MLERVVSATKWVATNYYGPITNDGGSRNLLVGGTLAKPPSREADAAVLAANPTRSETLNLTHHLPWQHKKATGSLWNGMSVSWKRLPHRLNQLGSWLGSYGDSRAGSIMAHSAFSVGEYPDAGAARVQATVVESDLLGFYHGRTAAPLLVNGLVGERKAVHAVQRIPLKNVGMADYDRFAVVLRGFDLSCHSYHAGLNTRGFGIRILPGARVGDHLVFDIAFGIHPEHCPERAPQDHFVYSSNIYYTVIGAPNDGSNFVEAHGNPTHRFSQRVPSAIFRRPPLDYQPRGVATIQGRPGFAHHVLGMQGFSWFLRDWSGNKRDGRYLRDFMTMLEARDYDPKTGVAESMARMHFSNHGAVAFGFLADFRMWATMVQFNGDGRSERLSGSQYMSGNADTRSLEIR